MHFKCRVVINVICNASRDIMATAGILFATDFLSVDSSSMKFGYSKHSSVKNEVEILLTDGFNRSIYNRLRTSEHTVAFS